MAAITTVIFDWGGVLIDDPAPGLLSIMSRTLGVGGDDFVVALKRHGGDFQTGRCTEPEFWQAVCTDLRVPTPKIGSLWGTAFREIYRPKPAVWDLARNLRKKGYKTALLSNTEMPGVELFRASQPHIFDELVFSCCEGCRKPEARIYQLALERLKSRPDEAVFIDDREDYAAGARAVGLHTILFSSPRALVRELAKLGVNVMA